MMDNTANTTFREFDAAHYKSVRRTLVEKNTRGKPEQIGFLRSALENSSFLKWFQDRSIPDNPSASHLPLIPKALTEHQFCAMSDELERKAYELWHDVTPSLACRPGFWVCASLNHIKHGRIQSSFLASPTRGKGSGSAEIDAALSSECAESIDMLTRRILHRISGLPESRGNVSLQANCVFGRAWWRVRMIDQTVDVTGADKESVTRTLHKSTKYWEKLVSVLTSRNSVFGDEMVRPVLVWALSIHESDPKYSNLFLAEGAIDKCMDLLGVFSAVREFGVFEVDELRDFIESRIIAKCVDTPSGNGPDQ